MVGMPGDVVVRALVQDDWSAVRGIYADGIATGHATFETEVPAQRDLEAKWLQAHRWVAEVDGRPAGWAAIGPTSARACYASVGETSIYVADGFRGRGVGRALLHRQVTAADTGGLWTLQTSIFPENDASLALHRAAGFRTVGIRERIASHHGGWRDTLLLERRRGGRSGTVPPPYTVRPIGWVESPLLDPRLAPKQGDEGSPDAWLVFNPDFGAGIRDLEAGSEIIVLTWLDRARRDVLATHPRGDPRNTERGIFSTRSPDRPNPVGLHRVRILSVAGLRVRVRDLEALDATPIVDVKPVLGPSRDG